MKSTLNPTIPSDIVQLLPLPFLPPPLILTVKSLLVKPLNVTVISELGLFGTAYTLALYSRTELLNLTGSLPVVLICAYNRYGIWMGYPVQTCSPRMWRHTPLSSIWISLVKYTIILFTLCDVSIRHAIAPHKFLPVVWQRGTLCAAYTKDTVVYGSSWQNVWPHLHRSSSPWWEKERSRPI